MDGRRKRGVQAGDTFAVPLEDGRFCAVRVIRTSVEDGASLVVLTPWLGDLPEAHEPVLREVLREHRGFYRGTLAIMWCDGKVPRDFVYVGVIPPSDEEQAYDPHGAYGGPWSRGMVRPVVLELEGLEQCDLVCPRETVASESRVDRVSGSMTDGEFWKIIEQLDWNADNDDRIVEPVVAALASLSVKKIAGFQARLCEKLFELDREDLAREIGEFSYGSQHFSPDHFLDVRCAIVANGRACYEGVLSSPSKMPKDLEFEALLTVAEVAYRRKTGREASFIQQRDCATFSNRRGWSKT